MKEVHNTNTNIERKYISEAIVLKKYHISSTTLWRMVKKGLIKKYKFGRRTLYDPEQLETAVVEVLIP